MIRNPNGIRRFCAIVSAIRWFSAMHRFAAASVNLGPVLRPRTPRSPAAIVAIAGGLILTVAEAHAQVPLVVKQSTGTNLAAGASWTGSVVPSSTTGAQWASTSLGGALTLASSGTWALMDVQGATDNLTIGGSRLTLSAGVLGTTSSVGINLPTEAGVDVTFNNNLEVAGGQLWRVNPGRTVTVNGVVGSTIPTDSTTFTMIVQRGGTLILNGANTFLNNTPDSWMRIDNSTTVRVNAVADGGVASPLGQGSAAASQLRINGGTIDYVGTGDSTNRLFALTSNSTIKSNGTGPLAFTGTGSIAYTTTGNVPSSGRILTLGGTSTAANEFRPILVDGTSASGLTKADSGKWILTGDNTFTGPTTVSAGELAIGKGGTTGSVAGDIVNNAAVTFDRSNAVTYAGNMTGTGSLTKTGAGTLTLTGTNTHGGTTTVSTGALAIGNGGTTGSVAGDIVNNTAVTFNRSDALDYAGNMAGTGSLTKIGAGALSLSGTNTHAGTTTVSAGSLLVDGSLANGATVENGGTIGGGGTIGSLVTVESGGILSPGNSHGLLTMGSLDLQAGSTTLMEIMGSGPGAGIAGVDYDKVVITTAGGLGYGGTLDLEFANLSSFADGTIFDLFGFTGGKSGVFSSVLSTGVGVYSGLTFTGSGGVWTTSAAGQDIMFDEATGQLRFESSGPSPTPIPEIDPAGLGSAIALLASGLGLLERRRIARKTA